MKTILNRRFFFFLVVSLLAGLFFAWVDTRPHWDDTGIEVAMILGSSICLGFGFPRFAWLWAILVGLWIPLINAFVHHDFSTSLVLVISFAGTYTGVFLKRMFKSHTA